MHQQKYTKIAIISNLPNTIFSDKTNFEILSKSIVDMPIVNPVFEIVEADSNNASIKLLLSRKPITKADVKDTVINKVITNNASFNSLFGIEVDELSFR